MEDKARLGVSVHALSGPAPALLSEASLCRGDSESLADGDRPLSPASPDPEEGQAGDSPQAPIFWGGLPHPAPRGISLAGDTGLIPGSGRSPGGGHGNPFQCSCLDGHVERGAWQAATHTVAKSRTRVKRLSTHLHSCHLPRLCPLLQSLLQDGPLWARHHSTFGVLRTLSEPSPGRGCADPLLDQAGSAQGLSSSAAGAPFLGCPVECRAGTSPASPRSLQLWNLLGKSCLSWFCTCPIPMGARPRGTPEFSRLSSALRMEQTHPEKRNVLEIPAGIITDLRKSTYSGLPGANDLLEVCFVL